MTFYNVISALLFMGAFRQLLLACESESGSQILMAGTLVILVFNDAVFTSHVVEGEKIVNYKLNLMLIDLTNFLLLSTAMVTVNPNNNVFSVSVPNLAHWLTETSFWLILMAYWTLIFVWTYIAGLFKEPYPKTLLFASMMHPLLFLLTALFALNQSCWLITIGRTIAFAYTVIYIIAIRPFILRNNKHSANS